MLQRILAIGALIAASTTPAFATDYTLDPAHTQAEFSVVHLAISRVHGQIPLVAGAMTTGAGEMPTSASATFDVRALDSHDANRDKSLRSPDFFDVEKYPTMKFVSKKIEGKPNGFTIMGDLTLHGVTKPVKLEGKLEATLDDRGKHHASYTATTTIDRREWGMDLLKTVPGGQLIAGNDVSITIEVDAIAK